MASNRRSVPDDLDLGIFDALDHPADTQPLVEAYWEKRREWEKLENAFAVCVHFMLEQRHQKESSEPVLHGH